MQKKQYEIPCNIAQSLNLIGDKWTLLILHSIKVGNTTYKDIQASLPGIPTNLLSNRLKSLEEDQLISSHLYSEHPPRYCYELCESAQALDDVYNAIILWGEKYLKTCYKKLVHKECGHSVRITYYCEHCDSYVEQEDLMVRVVQENIQSS